MFKSIWDDVKREFSFGNMVTRIIIINVVVFIFFNLLRLFLKLGNGGELPDIFNDILYFFSMSSDWKYVLTHPWVLVTSVFLHLDFWHILWNMLFLYWFGRIVGDLIGNQRVLPIYLLGGIAGSIIYFISANVFNYTSGFALGASAGVMAVVVAAGVTAPDYIMRLILLGDVKLKYIVGVLVLMDLLALGGDVNTGGHFGHIGGAFMGWLFIYQLRNGDDWALPVNNILDKISEFFKNLLKEDSKTKPKRKPKVVYRNPSAKRHTRKAHSVTDDEDLSYQEQIDAILDKIRETGYDSLSDEEKEFLFNASKNADKK